MALLKWLIIGLLVLGLAVVVVGQVGLLHGSPPADLGVHGGRLKAPSMTPNSVSSQADLWPGHPQAAYARVAPLPLLNDDGPATLARIKAIVAATPGARVVAEKPDYLYATFTTRLMKYTDDVEFWLDPAARVVQVRSASRLGRRDFDANRTRIDALRAQLATR